MMEKTGALRQHVLSLLQNTAFIRYVLESDESQKQYWTAWVERHPQGKEIYQNACYILSHLDSPVQGFTEEELHELRERIKVSLKSNIVVKV